MFIWLLLAVPLVVGGFLTGRSLQPGAEAVVSGYDKLAPTYVAAEPIAAVSPGGFSGFDLPDFEGQTVLAGAVIAVDGRSVTLRTTFGSESTLRVSSASSLSRIEAGALADVGPGTTVVARLAADGETVEALLIITR